MAGDLSLLRLPVEVISHIFECMDKPSLQLCCLVSHDFNDIATPILYGSIIVDVAAQESINTFRAFERRPQLRQYVRNVKFVDKWRGKRMSNWRSLKDHEFNPIVKHLGSCCSDLVLDLTDIPLYAAKIYYKNIIQVLKNVEELRLSWSYQLKPEALPLKLRRISLVNTPIPGMAEKWLESRNHILEELILSRASSNLTFLSGFTALRKFRVRHIQSWKSFVAAARDMKRLEDVTFSVEKCELKTTQVTLNPLSLPRLRSLNMTVYGSRRPPFIDTIYYVYETLAASSRSLENLRIRIWYADRIHQYEGGKLARLVARNHGSTIRSLIIDDMILSSENLSYLCLQCPNLETLGFGITKRTVMMGVSTPLNRLHGLSHLRLTISGARTSSECFHLMKQDLPQVALFHIRLYDKDRSIYLLEYTLWKSCWSYVQEPSSPIHSFKMTKHGMGVWDEINL